MKCTIHGVKLVGHSAALYCPICEYGFNLEEVCAPQKEYSREDMIGFGNYCRGPFISDHSTEGLLTEYNKSK